MKILKKNLCLLLIFVLSINSVAAIVSDNDGSAFITKAEFDVLKSSFQTQIYNYNQNIDRKIDEAITAYLSGIKLATIHEESFFDGLEQNVLIYNSQNIHDLKWGLQQFKWDWWMNVWNTQASSGVVTLKLTLKRELNDIPVADRDTEAFILSDDGTKLDHYTKKGRAILNSTITEQGVSGMIGFTNVANMKIRWHGWYGDAADGEAELDNTVLERHYKNYAQNFASYNSMKWYATAFNAGVGYTFGLYKLWDRVANAQWTDTADATLFMDGTADKNVKLYNSNLNTDLSQYYLRVGENNDTTLRATSSEFPIDATGVHTIIDGFQRGHMDSTAYLRLTGVEWWKTGSWTGDNTRNNYHEWEEIALDRKDRGSNILKQENIPTAILSKFSATGYSGQVNQGLPVVQIIGPGTIEFDMDMTSLGRSAVVAFKDTSFSITAANKVINTPLSSGLQIKIDETNVSTSAKELSNSIHNFKLTFNGEGEHNLFMFVGWPNSETSSKRAILKLPKVCKVIMQN